MTSALSKKALWKLKKMRQNIVLEESEIHFVIGLASVGAVRRQQEEGNEQEERGIKIRNDRMIIINQAGFHGFTGRERPSEE